jgi:hypothetical protein
MEMRQVFVLEHIRDELVFGDNVLVEKSNSDTDETMENAEKVGASHTEDLQQKKPPDAASDPDLSIGVQNHERFDCVTRDTDTQSKVVVKDDRVDITLESTCVLC